MDINFLLLQQRMDEGQLQFVGAFFKKEFHLEDWAINIRLKPLKSMGFFRDAASQYVVERNRANIWLITPDDFTERIKQRAKEVGEDSYMIPFPYDMVQSVVHELLHIKLGSAGMDVKTGAIASMQEGMVDWMAEYIAGMYRDTIRQGGCYDF